MNSNRNARGGLLSTAVAAVIALSGLALAAPASAFSYANGDLVLTFVKNGFELILDLGTTPTIPTQVSIDPANLMLPSQFGGSLAGAKWTALSVRNPDAQFGGDLAGLPQNNIILTTLDDPSVVGFFNIADAQAQLQPPNQGVAWFALLKSVGAPNGTSILENTADRLVIGTTLYASYTGNVGLGSDAVGNQLPLSTAAIISEDVLGDSLPLYELIQTAVFNPTTADYDLGTQIDSLGGIRLVPEPGTLLLLGAGLAGLVGFSRRS